MTEELWRSTAREAVARLERGEVTPLEMIDAALARVEAVDGAVNALPTICAERARDHARRLTARGTARPEGARGWLAGLPVAIKDLTDVAGVRTTYGSPIFADHVPERSDLLVDRIEAQGGIVLAKSNTPEFGAGGNTFNEVFGKTRNPWNTSLTCGGSSGGAATALATGQIWLAHGSDLGGSLRTPASFCSVVGLRPSPGRVARGPSDGTFGTMGVQGPMARDVADLALFLDAMAGQHSADPISVPAPAVSFVETVAAPMAPRRIGFSPDLGIVPVDREVRDICAAAVARFADLGTIVEEACPDLSDAMSIFHTLRAVGYVLDRGPLMETRREAFKPEIVWNYERGLKLTGAEIARAERARGALYRRVATFFETRDLLVCPAAIVPPFDVERRWVEEVEGHRFDNYVDWMSIACAISVTGLPACVLPCGFTADGRPVGLQLVGRPRDEAGLLQAAVLFEQVSGMAGRTPIDPRPGASPR